MVEEGGSGMLRVLLILGLIIQGMFAWLFFGFIDLTDYVITAKELEKLAEAYGGEKR